jgi:hypothetical protein
MGDETKKEEARKGNIRPLSGPLKPSTADAVDREVPDVGEMPSRDQAERMPAADRDRDQPRRRP